MAEAELDWRVSYAANILRYEETYMYWARKLLMSDTRWKHYGELPALDPGTTGI